MLGWNVMVYPWTLLSSDLQVYHCNHQLTFGWHFNWTFNMVSCRGSPRKKKSKKKPCSNTKPANLSTMAWLALRGLGGKKIDDLQSWNVSRERRSDEMLSGIYAEGWPFIIIFGIGTGNPTTTVSGVDSIYNFIYPIGHSCRPEWRYAVLSHLLEMDKIYC